MWEMHARRVTNFFRREAKTIDPEAVVLDHLLLELLEVPIALCSVQPCFLIVFLEFLTNTRAMALQGSDYYIIMRAMILHHLVLLVPLGLGCSQ
jgi:hypothetical protein